MLLAFGKYPPRLNNQTRPNQVRIILLFSLPLLDSHINRSQHNDKSRIISVLVPPSIRIHLSPQPQYINCLLLCIAKELFGCDVWDSSCTYNILWKAFRSCQAFNVMMGTICISIQWHGCCHVDGRSKHHRIFICPCQKNRRVQSAPAAILRLRLQQWRNLAVR